MLINPFYLWSSQKCNLFTAIIYSELLTHPNTTIGIADIRAPISMRGSFILAIASREFWLIQRRPLECSSQIDRPFAESSRVDRAARHKLFRGRGQLANSKGRAVASNLRMILGSLNEWPATAVCCLSKMHIHDFYQKRGGWSDDPREKLHVHLFVII